MVRDFETHASSPNGYSQRHSTLATGGLALWEWSDHTPVDTCAAPHRIAAPRLDAPPPTRWPLGRQDPVSATSSSRKYPVGKS